MASFFFALYHDIVEISSFDWSRREWMIFFKVSLISNIDMNLYFIKLCI